MVSDLEIYLFDLRGYVVLPNALTLEEVAELNECLDAIPPMEAGEWYGYVHAHRYGTTDGFNLQQIYEAGEPFERLIDHPSWIDKVKHFVGGEGSFDYHHGPLFIDLCHFSRSGGSHRATLRGIPTHSSKPIPISQRSLYVRTD